MTNSIELAKKFVPVLDEIYKQGTLTEGMDAATKQDFTGVNEVKVLKVVTTGLGDYDRSNGYPKGDVTVAWETLKLTEERGKEFGIDRMDNEETLGMAFGAATSDFMRSHVIPEIDAFRFARYASKEGILAATAAVLTKDDIITAIDEAVKAMNAEEVPLEGRVLYINSNLQPILNSALTRQWGSDGVVNTILAGYNGMPIKWVVPTRFYTGIASNAGVDSWGYAKAAEAKNINFMLIHPSAILQAKKLALPKIFSPDDNQAKDEWKFQFRLYHDAFVYENKVKGIYLHKSTV